MSMQPWDFSQAKAANDEASREQELAEQELGSANRLYAQAEESYRKALALEMWRLRREDKVAWSVLSDLARGDEQVAKLKRARDDAEGNRTIASHAVFRRSADRKAVEGFISWSMRRELAEGAGRVPEGTGETFGARRAA